MWITSRRGCAPGCPTGIRTHLRRELASWPGVARAGFMADRLFPRGSARIFQGLGPRSQVALCQLPLTLIVAALAIATPFAWPTLLHSPLYLAGIILSGALFLGCLLVPWERLAHRPYLLIPILDFVSIGLLRNGAAPLLPGLAV